MRVGGGSGIALAIAVALVVAGPARAQVDTLTFGKFGTVRLFRSDPHPAHVIVYLSGDGGWDRVADNKMPPLTSVGALVIGADMLQYKVALRGIAPSECVDVGGDVAALSQFVQKKLGAAHPEPPILVGHSAGATLAYAALAQSPANTFRGGIGLGFCTELPTLKPLCKGSGFASRKEASGKGVEVLPASSLSAPFVAIQGGDDEECGPAVAEPYTRSPGSALIPIPTAGHGFNAIGNWLPQFKKAFARLEAGGVASELAPLSNPASLSAAEPPLAWLSSAGDH